MLEPILGFSCVAAATLLTLVIIIGRVFNSGDLFALTLFYLAVFLTYTCDLRKFSLLVFSVSCEVGADVIAVSSASFLPMCVCSLPGLLPGCYALALVDT